MSLILDAINRSQRERANPGEVPGVATVHYAEATVAPSAWRQGLIGLALVLALGGLTWYFLRPAPEVDPSAPAAPDATQAAEPAPDRAAPSPEPIQQPVSQTKPQLEPAETASRAAAAASLSETPPAAPVAATPSTDPAPSAEVSALYAQAGRGEGGSNATGSRGQAPAAGPTAKARQGEPAGTAQAAAGSKPATAQGAATVEEPLDVSELVARARAEMRNATLPEHPAPFLSELSQQRKDAIPTLMYSQHDYRGDGGRSTVMINGKTVTTGQSIGKGVKVEEILPDSVVLSFAGESFRLKALNSWVNL